MGIIPLDNPVYVQKIKIAADNSVFVATRQENNQGFISWYNFNVGDTWSLCQKIALNSSDDCTPEILLSVSGIHLALGFRSDGHANASIYSKINGKIALTAIFLLPQPEY